MQPTKSRLRAVWILVAILTCLGAVNLFSQPQVLTSLNGTVTDQAGAAVPGAQIVLTNKTTGQTITTVSNSAGDYQFSNLVPGKYDLAVRFLGFNTTRVSGIEVLADAAARTDVTLRVGESQTVSGAGPGISLTSRAFLAGNQDEKPGYGLYSYILFGSPPNDATRELYLAVLAEFLKLPPSLEVEKTIPLKQLNITMVPVKGNAEPDEADKLLAAYDFPRAAALLTKISCRPGDIPCGPHLGGPYIVSTDRPLSGQTSVSGHFLYQDLSSVPARIVPLWVDEFQKQAAQVDFWKKRNGPQAALKVRTAIALLGDSLAPTEAASAEFKKALASITWHK